MALNSGVSPAHNHKGCARPGPIVLRIVGEFKLDPGLRRGDIVLNFPSNFNSLYEAPNHLSKCDSWLAGIYGVYNYLHR